MENPKLFISYSWTTPEHEEWVLNLAKALVDSGIDVVIDKWALRPGHDSNSFMEKMVSDPDIRKVIMICDETYASKADDRKGGVGTETQIISPEVYAQQNQSKFVAVLPPSQPDQKARVPVYYKSKLHIDLSNAETHAQNFEQLVRWVYDKPLHMRPDLGTRPAYLSETEPARLPTSAPHMRAIDAVKNTRSHAESAVVEYLTCLAENLEKFRIKRSSDDVFDDQVIESIDAFIPYRNEFIALISAACQHPDAVTLATKVHRFFEQAAPYLHYSVNVGSYIDTDFDNFRFIVHELFLYTISIPLKYEKFVFIHPFVDERYYSKRSADYGNQVMQPFTYLLCDTQSLEHRNARLNLRRYSLRTDLLKARCTSSGYDFNTLKQADLLLWLRSIMENHEFRWWCETLFHSSERRTLEVFARCISPPYFQKLKPLMGAKNLTDLRTRVKAHVDNQHNTLGTPNYISLLGINDWREISN